MNKKASIVIGRFQPVHFGHLSLFRKATEDCDLLLIVLGSAQRPSDIKNPFSDHDRTAMITAMLENDNVIKANKTGIHNVPKFAVHFVSVHDYFYGDKDTRWATELRDRVHPHIDGYDVTLYGYNKDSSSYYLDLFPEWNLSKLEASDSVDVTINATDIRNAMFQFGKVPGGAVCETTERFINHWMTTPAYENLKAEWYLVKKIKIKWANAPYPVSFTTVDAVVIHKGHVLMIRRGVHPGKGLLALPGGHLDVKHDASLIDGALRELREETGLVLSKDTVFNKHPVVFDSPERSVRGRYITNAFMWLLDNSNDIQVVGGDDAEKAMWIPLHEVHRKYHLIFEDHAEIIENMVGKL